MSLTALQWVKRVGASGLMMFALTASAGNARADTDPKDPLPDQHWSPRYRKVGTREYVWTAVSGAALGVELYLYMTTKPPMRWHGGILFDDAVRDALVIDQSSKWHSPVATASWAIFVGSMLYPFVIDVPVAWSRGGSRLAKELFWQSALVLTTTAALDLGIREFVGRARPRESACLDAGGTEAQCLDNKEATRSFPNGHFAVGMSMASMLCVQHFHTNLYGGAGDGITCATALAANLSMGVMRIMVDKHWATDTLVGGALGSLTGWLLPTLLWYRGGKAGDDTASKLPPMMPGPMLVQGGAGLSLTGLL